MPNLLTEISKTPGITEAFFAGLLSFLSPCLLPLIPVYIMYLKTEDSSDSAPSEDADTTKAASDALYDAANKAENQRAAQRARFLRGLKKSIMFVLGFTAVFMLFGLAASSVGKFLIQYRGVISRLAGVFIVLFGLTMLGVVRINALTKDYRRMRSASAFGMGMAFGFGWTPCLGPILGSILAMTAAVTSKLYEGIFLLFIYSLGVAIPFLLSYVFIEIFEKHITSISKHSAAISKAGAVVMIIFGLLLVFDKLSALLSIFQ